MGTSPFALVKERLTESRLQADKKIVPAKSGTRKVLIRIKCLVKWSGYIEKVKKFTEPKNLVRLLFQQWLLSPVERNIIEKRLRRDIFYWSGKIGVVHID
jgi:hypothetical protein